MIKNIRYIISNQFSPYENLALEEYIFRKTGGSECILYLWQNEKTVVIGRNQDCLRECRLSELEEDGGRVARRLSGGGAVYHDLGNLNFTFMAGSENYSLDLQTDVILNAVRALGIDAEKNGRNDLTVSGRKFSGNAYYHSGGSRLHHGTILMRTDTEKLDRYLSVSPEKMRSKAVDSVRSRVINLSELNGEITVELMKAKMLESFSAVYGADPSEIKKDELDFEEIDRLTSKFSSRDWIFQQPIPYMYKAETRFPWGEICVQFDAPNGRIQNTVVYSDSLDTDFIANLPGLMNGKPLSDFFSEDRFIWENITRAM